MAVGAEVSQRRCEGADIRVGARDAMTSAVRRDLRDRNRLEGSSECLEFYSGEARQRLFSKKARTASLNTSFRSPATM